MQRLDVGIDECTKGRDEAECGVSRRHRRLQRVADVHLHDRLVRFLQFEEEARDEDRREPVRVARELAPMSVLLRLSNSMTSFEAKLTGW